MELRGLRGCETGLGRAATGFGLRGLRESFQAAGALSVVTSMWRIPLEPSLAQCREFMDQMSDHSQSRYIAFHRSQLAALENSRRNYGSGHPLMWGGLIFIGHPGDN